mmetsp:Transcript_12600/g.39762  ORF Transcript_12600/g.39762 Transcript_12600/m.39762 type:complete len:275 (-) Transcript_12600:788-1612(-)
MEGRAEHRPVAVHLDIMPALLGIVALVEQGEQPDLLPPRAGIHIPAQRPVRVVVVAQRLDVAGAVGVHAQVPIRVHHAADDEPVVPAPRRRHDGPVVAPLHVPRGHGIPDRVARMHVDVLPARPEVLEELRPPRARGAVLDHIPPLEPRRDFPLGHRGRLDVHQVLLERHEVPRPAVVNITRPRAPRGGGLSRRLIPRHVVLPRDPSRPLPRPRLRARWAPDVGGRGVAWGPGGLCVRGGCPPWRPRVIHPPKRVVGVCIPPGLTTMPPKAATS